MGFGSYVKRGASAISTFGASEAGGSVGRAANSSAGQMLANPLLAQANMLRKKAGGKGAGKTAFTPEARTSQPFDYTQIAKQLKQMEAVKGKAINPDIMKSLVSGAIEGQVTPAMEREDRAMARDSAERMHREKIDAKREAAEGGGMLSGILGGAGVGAKVGGPWGALAGGILGGGASKLSIICTELQSQGFLDIKVIKKATLYRRKSMPEEVYLGYLIWAAPLVRLMQESTLATNIVKSFWIPLTYELAARTEGKKGNIVGKISLSILSPFSRVVFRLKGREVCYG